MLTDRDLLTYSRQIVLPEIGPRGQERLQQARVAIVGLGGLGSPAALYLAAAGVANLTLIDDDRVAPSNLQRQILHGESDLETAKTQSADAALRRLNPRLRLTLHQQRLNQDNANSLLAQADFAIDATDNPESKFLIAEACHRLGLPYSHAGVSGFRGQTMTVRPGRTACLRCLFENPPTATPTVDCRDRGMVGAIAGILGSLQALEAIKIILETGEPLTGRLLIFDGLTMTMRQVRFRRHPQCPLCAELP